MPSFKGFMQYDKAGWAMLTAAIGTAWSPALGAPTRITHSREVDEVALLFSPVPRPFRDGIRPPALPSPSIASVTSARLIFRICLRALRRGDYLLRPKQFLKAETQNVPIRLASSLLHLRSVVAFHAARYLRELARPMGWASAIRPSAPTLTTTTNQSRECP